MRLTFWLRCPVDSGSGRQSRGHLRRAGSNCIRPVKRLCLRRSGGKLVFTSGCDGCAGIGASALEALVTVAVSVFLPQRAPRREPRRGSTGAASRLSTSSSRRTDSIFWSVTNSASVASGIVLSSSILSSNRTSIVACMVPLRWIPVGDLVLTGASFYWTLEDFATRPKCRGHGLLVVVQIAVLRRCFSLFVDDSGATIQRSLTGFLKVDGGSQPSPISNV